MNDATLQEFQRAARLLTQSSTAEVRLAIQSTRRLDRSGELARRIRLLEIACLVRDRNQSEAEAMLGEMVPIPDAEWRELQTNLAQCPERVYPAFVGYCKSLKGRFEPQQWDAFMGDPPGSHGIHALHADRPEGPWAEAAAFPPLSVVALALGILALGTCWLAIPVLGFPRGLLGVLAGIMATALAAADRGAIADIAGVRRSKPQIASFIIAILGTLCSLTLMTLALVGVIP